MMRIDSISSQADRSGRFLVKLANGRTMRLYRQTVEDFGLYTGLELDDERVSKLKEAAGQMSAKMRAVRIVAASNVSKEDLQQRLVRKGESPRQAREAVQWMEELDLVDDEKTARLLVERCIAKGYGRSRAKQVLYEKKIPDDIWDTVLEDYPDQTEKIADFLRSRLQDGWQERDLKRTIDALLRRGHSYNQIRQELKLLEMDQDSFREEF